VEHKRILGAVGRPGGQTFGELAAAGGLAETVLAATRDVIRRAGVAADDDGRAHLKVVSCHTCTAPKACCTLITTAFLHEAVPIAARLRAEGRDTPELRARLRASAEAMESSHVTPYQAPCVFLGDGERCTIYEHRPSECGVCFVYSPAAACSDPAVTEVERYHAAGAMPAVWRTAELFRVRMGLPALAGRMYVGAMPRMVLVCLQTWDRDDFAKTLARRDWPAIPGG
jgi:Fe-S-cluster containining protein